METDTTTRSMRLRSSNVERLPRKQRVVSASLTGASTIDDNVIPPPSRIEVNDFSRVRIFTADGRAFVRKLGF